MGSVSFAQDHLTTHQRGYGILCTALNRSAHAQCKNCRYDPAVLIFFSRIYGPGHRTRGLPPAAWVLGHLPNRSKHPGSSHISSLSVKCASCHGTRTKCSPTFFFQCLVMEDPLHVATKTSEEVCSQIVMIPVLFFFLFLFFDALDPFRLGVILQVTMRSINPMIIRPVPAGLSPKLCRRCRKAALAPFWTPVSLRNPATPTELVSLFFFFFLFSSLWIIRDKVEDKLPSHLFCLIFLLPRKAI